MPKMIKSVHEDKIVTITDALKMKINAIKSHSIMPKFYCTECGLRVRPHKAGKNNGAHFEHLKRNKNCLMSHKI